MRFRHFVACEDCNIVMKIRPGDHQYCYNCNGSNIFLFTLKGTKEELDNIDGQKYTNIRIKYFRLNKEE